MAVLGLRINGRLASSSGGGPPSTTDYVPFAITAGQPGGPTPGTNTFTLPNMASGLVVIFVNDVPCTIGTGFTVDYGTGEVTYLGGNFVDEDTIAGSYVGT